MKVPLHLFQTRRLASSFTILATLSTGILIGSVVAHGVHGQDKTVDTRDATPLHIPDPKSLSTAFSQIAKQVEPAVVNINVETLPKANTARNRRGTPQQQSPEGPDDGQGGDGGDQGGDDGQGQGGDNGMQDFFNRFFGGVPGGGGGQAQQESRALGSGFIVDPRGYIVTNDHVVDKADRIYVKLSSDPENSTGHKATVIGVDKGTDLAVVKIDVGHPLPTVKLGNSDGAEVGDWVEAIGSPFDLNETVTAGIISAKNRNIELGAAGQFKHYIQTDAAINPGNSGGPLLDMAGEVIGVNTAIFSSGGGMGGEAGNMGIGFAMPSNTVIDVYNQLIGPEHKVIRGSIGISFQSQISPAVAKMYGAGEGVLINAVTPGLPAEKAGLKANDVIVSIDGKPIKTGDDLVSNITPRHPGSTVSVGYLRGGQKMTATVNIVDRDEVTNAQAGNHTPNGPDAGSAATAAQTKLGLTVTDLPQNAPSKLHGVLIRAVKPGSFADELNPSIGPGLIIEAVNRQPVRSKEEFDNIVANLKSGADVVFEITDPRGTGSSLVGGTLP